LRVKKFPVAFEISMSAIFWIRVFVRLTEQNCANAGQESRSIEHVDLSDAAGIAIVLDAVTFLWLEAQH